MGQATRHAKGNRQGEAAKTIFLGQKILGKKIKFDELIASFVNSPNAEDTLELARRVEERAFAGKRMESLIALKIFRGSDSFSKIIMQSNGQAEEILDCLHRIAYCDGAKAKVRVMALEVLNQFRPGSGA